MISSDWVKNPDYDVKWYSYWGIKNTKLNYILKCQVAAVNLMGHMVEFFPSN